MSSMHLVPGLGVREGADKKKKNEKGGAYVAKDLW